MTNWYKPGEVKVTRVEPDPRPPKPKPDWKAHSDVLDYQARNIEKIRKRLNQRLRRLRKLFLKEM